MSAPVVAVGPDTLASDVAGLLRARQIGAVPVIDGDRRLLGIVSEADLLASEAGPVGGDRPVPASDLMTRQVVTVTPQADAEATAQLLVRRRLRHVPVVEQGRVVGMLSRRDLVGMLHLTDADIRASLVDVLDEELGTRRPRVEVRRGHVLVDLPPTAPGYRLVESLARSVPGVLSVSGSPED